MYSPIGNDFAAHVLWRAKQLIANVRADDADVPGVLVVDRVEHPTVFDDVLVHLECVGPGAHQVTPFGGLTFVRDVRKALGRAFLA